MHARLFAAAAVLPPLLVATEAYAQAREIGSTAPAVYADDEEYRIPPKRLGGLSVSFNAEAKIEYDDNVYAEPSGKDGDVRFEFLPRIQVSTSPGPLTAKVDASGMIRRFGRLSSENVETGLVDGSVRWALGKSSTASGRLFWQRSAEERGDPESNIGALFGPRITNILGSELRYRTDSGRILVDLEATATRYDALPQRDADRDFSGYTARATLGLRTTSTVFVTAMGFASRRDFRLDLTSSGIKRNSSTYGGRLGLDIQPGGVIEGNISAGIFRFDPDDPMSSSKTGISVSGSLQYRPRRRTAVLLTAFRGDAATFRSGALQRTDTTAKLGVQQEVRHNLLFTPTVGYRMTRYNGSGQEQRTLTGSGELEYIFSRNMSVAANVSYSDRHSDDDFDDNFKRFRGGLSLRLRF